VRNPDVRTRSQMQVEYLKFLIHYKGVVLRATVVGMFSCHWIYLKNNMNISIFKQGKNIVNFKKVHLIPLQ
jgi:hypothetical protein